MNAPDWRSSRAGTRVRVALWLAAEVGPGGTFSKSQLREAFPKVEQIDRRMRDLRPDGWVIATYREDRSLASDELRLVRIGGPVWVRGYRSTTSDAVSDKTRRAILAAHNYSCAYCGIGPGEKYADDPLRAARLSIGRDRSRSQLALIPLCDRCLAGGRVEVPSLSEMHDAIESLSTAERARLEGWMATGERTQTPAEVVWAKFRSLPDGLRAELLRSMRRR